MADETTPTPSPKLSVKLPQAPKRVELKPKAAVAEPAAAPEPAPAAEPTPALEPTPAPAQPEAATPEPAAAAPKMPLRPKPAAPHRPSAPHRPAAPRRPGVAGVPAAPVSSALVPTGGEEEGNVGKVAAVVDALALVASIAGLVLVALEYFALSYK